MNNAGVNGMIVTDPDALRSAIAAAQVGFHMQFLYFWKSVVDGTSKKDQLWNYLFIYLLMGK